MLKSNYEFLPYHNYRTLPCYFIVMFPLNPMIKQYGCQTDEFIYTTKAKRSREWNS